VDDVSAIAQTFQPVTHQRGTKPFLGKALLIDGQLFSPHLPAAPRGASAVEKLAYEARCNLRAQWRLVRHAGPDSDGVTRWRCPFPCRFAAQSHRAEDHGEVSTCATGRGPRRRHYVLLGDPLGTSG
jgi:hypothetical protein